MSDLFCLLFEVLWLLSVLAGSSGAVALGARLLKSGSVFAALATDLQVAANSAVVFIALYMGAGAEVAGVLRAIARQFLRQLLVTYLVAREL